jgi:hypothetical protein
MMHMTERERARVKKKFSSLARARFTFTSYIVGWLWVEWERDSEAQKNCFISERNFSSSFSSYTFAIIPRMLLNKFSPLSFFGVTEKLFWKLNFFPSRCIVCVCVYVYVIITISESSTWKINKKQKIITKK